jgi:hypothetical protein
VKRIAACCAVTSTSIHGMSASLSLSCSRQLALALGLLAKKSGCSLGLLSLHACLHLLLPLPGLLFAAAALLLLIRGINGL